MRALLRLATSSLVLVAAVSAGPSPAASPDPGRSRLGPFAPRPWRSGGAPPQEAAGSRRPARVSPTPAAVPRRPSATPAAPSRAAANPTTARGAGAHPATPTPSSPPLARAPRSHRTVVVPVPAVPLAHPVVDVLVLGGGLNALLVAHQLGEAGVACRVLAPATRLEAARRPVHYPHGVTAPDGLAALSPNGPVLGLAEGLKLPLGAAEPTLGAILAGGVTHVAAGRAPRALLADALPVQERSAFYAWDARMAALHHAATRGALPPDVARLRELSMAGWMQRTSGLSARAQGLIALAARQDLGGDWARLSALEGVLAWQRFSARPAEARAIEGGGRALLEALVERAGRERLELGRVPMRLQRVPEGVEVYVLDPGDHEVRRYLGRQVVLATSPRDLRSVAVSPAWPPAVSQLWRAAEAPDAVVAHVIVDASAARFWRPAGRSLLPLATDGPVSLVRAGVGEGRGYELLEVTWRGSEATAWRAHPTAAGQARLVAALEAVWPEFGPHVRHVAPAPEPGIVPLSWPVGHSRLEGGAGELLQPVHDVMHLALEGQAGPEPDDALATARQVVARITKALGRTGGTGPSPGAASPRP
ncbi:MAG: FAD-dependent oxidoreductase [Candidatus Sericytochromatia bacterium]|nr:FAD-dependent oxidoreductase [Candidatus Sericytochromatia bacterium]